MAFHNQPSTSVSTLILLLLLILLLNASLYQPSLGFSTRYGSTRGLFGSSDNCGELVVQSQCSQNAKCSWCTSKDLDDMCFSKAEAWRLPHQVYSCRLIRGGTGSYGVSSSKNSVVVKNMVVEKDGDKLPLGTQISLSSRWGIFMRNRGGLMFLTINKLQISSDR